MLEFALRQERAKYQKLQYGVEQTQQQIVNNGTQSSEGQCLLLGLLFTQLYVFRCKCGTHILDNIVLLSLWWRWCLVCGYSRSRGVEFPCQCGAAILSRQHSTSSTSASRPINSLVNTNQAMHIFQALFYLLICDCQSLREYFQRISPRAAYQHLMVCFRRCYLY